MDADLRFLQVAAAATTAAADGLKADNDRAAERGTKVIQRFEKQRAIEEAITRLSPDFCEAAEILDALRASLEKRDCDSDTHESICVYGKAFRDCLDRADDAEAARADRRIP